MRHASCWRWWDLVTEQRSARWAFRAAGKVKMAQSIHMVTPHDFDMKTHRVTWDQGRSMTRSCHITSFCMCRCIDVY